MLSSRPKRHFFCIFVKVLFFHVLKSIIHFEFIFFEVWGLNWGFFFFFFAMNYQLSSKKVFRHWITYAPLSKSVGHICAILKEISPGISLEGMMLKLKLQYFGHLLRRVDSLEKTLMLGGIGGRRRRDDRGWDGWMASLTRWTWVSVYSRSWWRTGRPGVLRFMGSQRVGHDWATDLIWSDQPN